VRTHSGLEDTLSEEDRLSAPVEGLNSLAIMMAQMKVVTAQRDFVEVGVDSCKAGG